MAPEWAERASLVEGGDGSRGIPEGTVGFFLLEGGTSGGGRDMGTGSPSRALYTRYMAWGEDTKQWLASPSVGARLGGLGLLD